MSSELSEMLLQAAYWQQNFNNTFFTFFRHHNSTHPRFYTISPTTNLFSTEEDRDPAIWPTTWQVEVADYDPAGVSQATAACDTEGRLFTWGLVGTTRGISVLGHGPLQGEVLVAENSKTSRAMPTRVFGENGELDGVRFVKCQARSLATSGLSSEGVLYIAGLNRFGLLGDGLWSSGINSGSVAEAAISRSFHKPLAGYKWRSYAQTSGAFVAISESGDLYHWGFEPFLRMAGNFNQSAFSSPVIANAGFVDEVAIVSPGSGSYRLVGVSSPQLAGGRTATIAFSGDQNGLSHIEVVDPGIGYTTAPTITFAANDQQSVAPVVSCSLFSSSWSECYATPFFSSIALISTDGWLYTMGQSSLTQWSHTSASVASRRQSLAPRKHRERKAQKVSLGSNHGMYLAENGDLYGWGYKTERFLVEQNLYGESEYGVAHKLLEGAFVDIAANQNTCIALKSDGAMFATGQATDLRPITGTGNTVPLFFFAPVEGSIRAKRVWRSLNNFVVLRDQTYDDYGNPIYAA